MSGENSIFRLFKFGSLNLNQKQQQQQPWLLVTLSRSVKPTISVVSDFQFVKFLYHRILLEFAIASFLADG